MSQNKHLKTFSKYLTWTNFFLSFIFLILVGVAGIMTYFAPDAAEAQVNDPTPRTLEVVTNEGYRLPVTFQATGETLSSTGYYSVTYRFSLDEYKRTNNPPSQVTFPVKATMHKCPEGNGQNVNGFTGVCIGANPIEDQRNMTLNGYNAYTMEITYNIQQDMNLACGSFQSDIATTTATSYPGMGFLTGSLLKTGRDLGPNCMAPSSFTMTATPFCDAATSRVRVNWTQPQNPPTPGNGGYFVTFNGLNAHNEPLYTTSFVDPTPKTPGQSYTYQVRAQTNYGTSFSNTQTVTALACVSPTPIPTPSVTPTPKPSVTPTPTPKPSYTPTPKPSYTPKPTPTPCPSSKPHKSYWRYPKPSPCPTY